MNARSARLLLMLLPTLGVLSGCDASGGQALDDVGGVEDAWPSPSDDASATPDAATDTVGPDEPSWWIVHDPPLAACEQPDSAAGLPSTLTVNPIPELYALREWEGWAFHHTHWHNEGVGAWYFYPEDEPLAVLAPADARVCTSVRQWVGPVDDVPGPLDDVALVPDARLELELADGRRARFEHLWVLASVADALEAAGDDGIQLAAGQLIGFTSAGGAAVDLRWIDPTLSNGLPELEALHELPYRHCPLDAFPEGSSARAELLEAWTALSYEPAVATREEAEAVGERSHRGYAELAVDSCSVFDVGTPNHGTIWGGWYNAAGPLADGDPLGGWFHYPRGTVTLLPNQQLNAETYTVGYGGEAGLFTEMMSFYWPAVDDRWLDTRFAASLWLPGSAAADASAGCFMLSLGRTEDDVDPLWVYWELDAGVDGDDALALTPVWSATSPDACVSAGSAQDPAEMFTRYPN